MAEVGKLSLKKQRAIGAVVGAAVADAATRPMHWLYDRKKLEEIVGEGDPAFYPTNCSPFYSMPTGSRSCYNDIGFVMLSSLAPGPVFSRDTYVDAMYAFFDPASSRYAKALALRNQLNPYDPNRRMVERVCVEGPWQQASVTKFLEGYAAKSFSGNPEVKETDGLCSTIPLIAALASAESPRDVYSSADVHEAAALLSSNPFCVRHTLAAGYVIQKTIADGNPPAIDDMAARLAVETDETDRLINDELQQVQRALLSKEPHSDAVERWGKQCANPGSFMGGLLAIHSSSSFADGVRKTIKAGGCNCSRNNFVGSVLGARYCVGGIPEEWLVKTDNIQQIMQLCIEKM